MARRYLPALRGRFGQWAYYSCLMPLPELAERVNFAKELHKSVELSKLIQRQLKEGRTLDIVRYLKTDDERFFNSLVVAVYSGAPSWHDFTRIKPDKPGLELTGVTEEALASIGFLSFDGGERLFALDGQHRLSGIKRAVVDHPSLSQDEVSVVFVAHEDSKEGLRRTRRLFTTLNKTAKPVTKGEIIALDEADVMAIVVRRLVEEHKYFSEKRVLIVAKANLPANNDEHLTTIVNLYDVLGKVFSRIKDKTPLKELQFNRPPDAELDEYFDFAVKYFKALAGAFPELREYFASSRPQQVIKRWRTSTGGSVLFRPVGLAMFTEIIERLCKGRSLKAAMKLVRLLPTELTGEPYQGLLWRPGTKTMDLKGRRLVRDILLYMLGQPIDARALRKEVAEALDVSHYELPDKVVSS